MLSDADYKELKAQQKNLNNEGRAALREYELSNPQHAVESTGIRKLEETEPEAKTLNVPELPAETQAPKPVDKLQAFSDQVNTPVAGMDLTRDEYLPNASKLKSLAVPPEYVAKNPLNGIKHIAIATLKDPLDGPAAGTYYEPSEKQFQADMGDVLAARGIAPGTEDYAQAFAEYKDRKWAQAYQQAEANDTPLTRAEYIERHGAWEKLKGALAEMPDVASAFAKGFASGGTLHATEALETNADREQADRDPIARGAGELVGSMRTTGPLAKITKYAGGLASKVLPSGMFGRVASGAIAGGAAGAADAFGRSAAEALRGEPNAKERFIQALPGSTLVGAGFGAGGQLLAEGANAFQKSTVADMPEIAQLRRGGGDTDIIRGVKPGKDVAANIEAAREPIPGEAKPPPEGNATEIAARKLQTPLTEANASAHSETHRAIAAEQDAAIAANPKLQEQLPANKTAQAAVDWALAKLQPEARPGYLPGVSKPLSAEVLPGADIAEVQKLAPRLWKPRLVTAADAESIANKARGRAITLDEAQKLGLDIPGLSTELGPEGVPLNAPPIPSSVNPVDVLPRYSKDVLSGAAGSATAATPEEAEAIRRYTFGKRNPGDVELINQYLEKAPVSPLPHVYRGLVMPADQAAEFLANDTFNIGDQPTSVSSDPITARSFVARNLNNAGDVGITLKLEHSSARDIQPFANDQVKVEKELLLPKNSNFEIVSKHKDASNPGNWIVVAREIPADQGGASTVEDVFGTPAEKPGAFVGPVRGATPGRAKPPPAPEPGSDWDNPDEAKARFDWMYGNTPSRAEAPAAKPDDVTPTRVSENVPRLPRERWETPSSPSGPPSELRAPVPPAPPSNGPPIGGIPRSEYRVILEPRRFDAKTFEEILGDVDRKAKAGSATAQPDPAWKALQRAIREDRSQFGKDWTDLIAKHHEQLNDVEQRSYHAGINEKKPYSEMQGSSQQTLNGKLVDFPGGADSQKALRELAAQAGPGVQHDLEVLGAQNAYSKLKGLANPKIGETLGAGGVSGHLRGLGPSVRLRTEALSRAVSAGPTGEPTITPRLAQFIRSNAPKPKYLPGVGAMGAGALGLKAGSVYGSTRDRGARAQTLSPSELQFLEQLIQAQQEAP